MALSKFQKDYEGVPRYEYKPPTNEQKEKEWERQSLERQRVERVEEAAARGAAPPPRPAQKPIVQPQPSIYQNPNKYGDEPVIQKQAYANPSVSKIQKDYPAGFGSPVSLYDQQKPPVQDSGFYWQSKPKTGLRDVTFDDKLKEQDLYRFKPLDGSIKPKTYSFQPIMASEDIKYPVFPVTQPARTPQSTITKAEKDYPVDYLWDVARNNVIKGMKSGEISTNVNPIAALKQEYQRLYGSAYNSKPQSIMSVVNYLGDRMPTDSTSPNYNKYYEEGLDLINAQNPTLPTMEKVAYAQKYATDKTKAEKLPKVSQPPEDAGYYNPTANQMPTVIPAKQPYYGSGISPDRVSQLPVSGSVSPPYNTGISPDSVERIPATGTTGTDKTGSESGSKIDPNNLPYGATLIKTYVQGQGWNEGVKLPFKEGGYTRDDIVKAGNNEVAVYDENSPSYQRGRPQYEGYYLAPNGQYYPVNQPKAEYAIQQAKNAGYYPLTYAQADNKYFMKQFYEGYNKDVEDFIRNFGPENLWRYDPNWRNAGLKYSNPTTSNNYGYTWNTGNAGGAGSAGGAYSDDPRNRGWFYNPAVNWTA